MGADKQTPKKIKKGVGKVPYYFPPPSLLVYRVTSREIYETLSAGIRLIVWMTDVLEGEQAFKTEDDKKNSAHYPSTHVEKTSTQKTIYSSQKQKNFLKES
ncbi:hypothetical protein TNIN_255411 [Trichonephila inaurata madagascariensis]|uniref:Uncharacterized protein n=1 Tax=Trichonephila inaurata madagascariensis TaxID=2747483 RepID=A0A8X6X9U5_9ARAC|nr:hypothetical protein TNIN_255411 [Trichonephila inaurata madagascariensis]